MADRTADAMGVGKKAVQVPEGTVSIGQEYRDDKTATEVILPEGLKHIGDSAFEGCVNLEKINFPEGLETIGEGAFAGCQKLKIQPFPASLRDIGERAFFGCSSIEAFRKDAGNTSFSVIEGVLYRGKSALTAYPAGNRERQFTIPEDVTSIDDYAFSGCTRLESITIGARLSSVTGKAFAGCRKLSSVEVSPRNETYNSFDDDLYSDEGSELVFMTPYPKRHLESLSGVERVGPFSRGIRWRRSHRTRSGNCASPRSCTSRGTSTWTSRSDSSMPTGTTPKSPCPDSSTAAGRTGSTNLWRRSLRATVPSTNSRRPPGYGTDTERRRILPGTVP